MSFIKLLYGASFLPVAFAAAMLGAGAPEQPSNQADQAEQARLGKPGAVDFPTSCSQPAQIHFLRGVAALHSFWYETARSRSGV